jgi:DNA-binding transcriptional ArsR family regulator
MDAVLAIDHRAMQRMTVTNIEIQEAALPPSSQPTAKWGDAIKAGFQVLPDALIRGQHLLKLNATDVVVIANLNQAWWFEERRPYLQPSTIARRMGVSERSIQRSLSRLRRKGYLRQVRDRQNDGTIRYYHDLSGLRAQLEQLARRDLRYSEALRADPVE